jgi:hypothetical protein
MKKWTLIIVAFVLCLVAPVHSAFAYGGGNGGGDDVSASRGDSTTPPAGFEPTEKKGETTRSEYGRTQLTPEEEKNIVKKIGRQLTPEERTTLEEMKSLYERAQKAFEEGDAEKAQDLRNLAISRLKKLPEVWDAMTAPPLEVVGRQLSGEPIIVTGDYISTPASDSEDRKVFGYKVLHVGEKIVAGKNGATITWPNGAKINLKPNTKIQLVPDGFRIHMGRTWIRLRHNERTKGFDALTPNAGAPRG